MRFIPEKFAPILVGLIIMTVMVNGLPFIFLIQKMPFSDPNFMQYWGRTVASVAPYAIPLAVITAITARISISFFVLKTPRN